MQVSGVLRFDALSKAGVEVLKGFESRNLKGIRFTFGPLPDRALMFWDSTASLPEVAHLIERISTHPELVER